MRTPAELDAVLDEVASWTGPNIVELLIESNPARAIFDFGLDGERGRGALYYSSREYMGGCFSRGEQTSEEDILLYYYMGSDTEYPLDSEVSLAVVRQAAHEYMTTGGNRPTSVDWQPAP